MSRIAMHIDRGRHPGDPAADAQPAAVVYPTPARETPARQARACLLGLGTAVPSEHRLQKDVIDTLARHWNLRGHALGRWQRIARGAAVAHRYGVEPIEDIIGLSTAERMQRYEQYAPGLAVPAARRALNDAGLRPERITDLIVVSCTGFAAPGLDIAITKQMALSPTVRRTCIGFMGCFGAINGLRAAVGACAADPKAVALVVCCELCSLHVRDDAGPENQVASALFGDGAAAAIVAGANAITERRSSVDASPAIIGELTTGHTQLIPEGESWMTWRATDSGFAMTLSREVPRALEKGIAGFARAAAQHPPASYIVHPGGPGILDAVETGLQLPPGAELEHARSVLRDCGNMSSGTVLFVLDRARQAGLDLPAMLLAFGPGLTIESLMLLPAEPARASGDTIMA